ncbi:MAG: hemerythrin domain-containing protein [Sphingomicrobium sp.]
MPTRTQSRSSNRQDNRSAFSWGDNAGPLIGAALAGAAIGFAANIGRKFAMQGIEAAAGDWLDMLKKDHDEIQKIVEQMLATDESQTWKRSMLLMKLAHKLDKHSYEEETVIYPALRDDNGTVEADQLDTEHGHVKTLIFDLKRMESDSPLWLEKVRKLRDSLDEHIRMEEEQVLPKLKRDLDEEQNAEITTMVNKAGFMMA